VSTVTPLPADQAAQVVATMRMEVQYRLFREFAKGFWDIAEPTAKLIWSHHMDAICDEIQAVTEESDRRRAIAESIYAKYAHNEEAAAAAIETELGSLPRLRLVLLIPPRYSKSTLVQRLLPAWRWLHRPTDQLLALSGVDTLIERDGLALRDIVKSDAYRTMQAYLVATKRLPQGDRRKGVPMGQAFILRADQFAKEKLQNSAGGTRAGHVLGGKYTGVNSDITVIDDPHDVDDGLSETSSPATKLRLMTEVRATYKDKIQDRLNSQIYGIILLIMQRVHPQDLADYMISLGDPVVCLPSEYQPDHPHLYTKGRGWNPNGCDWRTVPGEPLNPLRFPASVLAAKRAESPHGYATKELMRPSVQEGVKFRRDWFAHRYDEDPHSIAAECDEVVLSVDCANKAGARNDYTSMGVWGRKGARRYLLARRYFRAELPGLLVEFDTLVAEWPEATLKLVEDKANGTSLIQMRRDTVPGIVPVNPKGDKESRANFATAVYEAGNVWLPNASWVAEYVENMVGFGAGGMHDDDVDMTSQVMERWAIGVAPWLTPDLRASLSDPRPALTVGEHVVRWERRTDVVARMKGQATKPMLTDPIPVVFMGLVPGWAQGRAGSEAVAVFVDERGRMLSMVEVGTGGVDLFVEEVAMEANYWTERLAARYAELPGGPASQTVSALARKGIRLSARPPQIGQAAKFPGQDKAGFTGDKTQTAAVWSAFLAMLSEGLVGVRDGLTLTRLETVVETDGVPRMPDGTPLGGRVLAFLLALELAKSWRAKVVEEEKAKPRYNPISAAAVGDIWGARG
jgi:predicted phage terminase large subunit-like protein